MKILLSHGYFLSEDPKEQEIMRPYVPLGILYISAYLEKNGYGNEVFDSTFSSFEEWEKYMYAGKPDAVGIYVNLMTRLNVLKMMKWIRNEKQLSGTKIILGGPEVTHHAENFLKAGADFIVIGEGEQTMLELVQELQTGRNNFSSIHGLAYLKDGNYFRTDERILIKEIDELPQPARSKVNLQYYFDAWKSKHGMSAISLSTMRGCPYTCKWCSRAVYGLSYRRRNPALVADEIEFINKAFNADSIWFVDDVFTISHKWMKEFAGELEKRNLKIKYECITRADRMNEEVILLLKRSGCFRVWIGAESGSQKIIDAMDRRVKVGQVREMIQLAKKYGIEAGTFIMLGYPGETQNDIEETLNHLKLSDPDHYTITVTYPIKGTMLYHEVESSFTKHLDWNNNSDRQIDFKRTYSRKYYDFAVRWIYNEMEFHRARQNKSVNPFIKLSMHKSKAMAVRALMWLEKIKSPKAE
jgi:radical SAM superfamily enzyme YgiQ (UPF0313 family)